MDAVASAVGSSEVGSWVNPMIARGLLDVTFDAAAGAAVAAGLAAALGLAAAAALGLASEDGEALAAGLLMTDAAVVGGEAAAPLAAVGGAVGATAGAALHAANNAEAVGRTSPN